MHAVCVLTGSWLSCVLIGLSSPLETRVRQPAVQGLRRSPRAVGSPKAVRREGPAPDEDSGLSDSAEDAPAGCVSVRVCVCSVLANSVATQQRAVRIGCWRHGSR